MPAIEKKVFAHYYNWYHCDKSWKNSAHTPLLAKYHSLDRNVMRQHLKWAEDAGIDVLIVSWWNQAKFGKISSDDGLKKIISEAHQVKSPVKFSIYYEPDPAGNPAIVEKDLLYLLKSYGSHPNFFRANGAPVIFIYTRALWRLSPAQWKQVVKNVREKADCILSADHCLEDIWGLFDSLHYYNPGLHAAYGGYHDLLGKCQVKFCQQNGLIPVITVVPGFDSSKIAKNYVILDRQKGDVYRRSWWYAMKSRAPWVMITSFNEWWEGSEIEPGKEYGKLFLKITAEMASAFKNLSPAEQARRYSCGNIAPGEVWDSKQKGRGRALVCPKLPAQGKKNEALVLDKFYRLNGEPAKSKTIVSVAYDARSLHIKMTCLEECMDEIYSDVKGTDIFSGNDSVEIMIDTDNKGERFFHFLANSVGKKITCHSHNPAWQGKWNVVPRAEKSSWTIDAEIPFSALRKKPKKGQVWRMQFCRSRVAKRKCEQELSSAFPLFGDYLVGKRFGKITFG